MNQLILASSSLGRKRLLEYLKIPFEFVPSSLDEDKIIGKNPLETIRLRARMKGKEVAYRFQKSVVSSQNKLKTRYIPITDNQPPTTIVLSADSDAIFDGNLYSKPKKYQEAFKTLKALSGRTHEFITAIYIIKLEKHLEGGRLSLRSHDSCQVNVLLDDISQSYVTFRKLADKDIKLYLKLTEYTRYAGAYALSSAQNFITKIEGSISNVIGLPMELVIPVLNKLGLLRKASVS